MRKFSTDPAQIFVSAWKNRQLLWRMTKRQILAQYRGSVLGLAWSFFIPLIMLGVYTFVFSTVFKARWNTGGDSKTEFALVLFVGMIIHSFFSENMNRAPSLITDNVSYVKKVIFPLEILPWITIGVVAFQLVVSLFVWLLFFWIINMSVNWTVIFLPVVLMPLIFFTLGINFLFASLGVYFRDISQITATLSTILLFLSPIFYPASMLPAPFKDLVYVNPLTYFIEDARAALMWGELPNWTGWGVSMFVSLLVAWLGFFWFQKTRKGFADVI